MPAPHVKRKKALALKRKQEAAEAKRLAELKAQEEAKKKAAAEKKAKAAKKKAEEEAKAAEQAEEVESNEESEVVVIGKGIRADELAENAGTISYELLAALGNRIPRVLKT